MHIPDAYSRYFDCPTRWTDSHRKDDGPNRKPKWGESPFQRTLPLWRTPTRRSTRKEAGGAVNVPRACLLLINEMAAAVLLPASFVAFCAEGFFLAVADGLDPAGADATRGQSILDCTGAFVA